MAQIVPAILPKSYRDLEEKLALIRGSSKAVQVDVVDGIFAPSKTWPYEGGEHFDAIVAEDEGMPLWEDFEFEFDCMVSKPELEAPKFVHAGASHVVIHKGKQEILGALKYLQVFRGGDLGIKLGVALLPEDPPETFHQYGELCDFVQVMGIAKVGFQGSEFEPRALDLISSLRKHDANLIIQVDGGVKLSNAKEIATAGANALVVGSAIFAADNPLEALEELRDAVK